MRGGVSSRTCHACRRSLCTRHMRVTHSSESTYRERRAERTEPVRGHRQTILDGCPEPLVASPRPGTPRACKNDRQHVDGSFMGLGCNAISTLTNGPLSLGCRGDLQVPKPAWVSGSIQSRTNTHANALIVRPFRMSHAVVIYAVDTWHPLCSESVLFHPGMRESRGRPEDVAQP